MFAQPYLATITIFAGNFAPRSWALCQGQLMAISQNEALFALLGTTFGGDGVNTFALPDLRGRVAIHAGQAPGMSSYELGQVGGTENVTMLAANLPPHPHTLLTATGQPACHGTAGTVADPTNAVPALVFTNSVYATAPTGNVMATVTCSTFTAPAGQSQPISIISPYLAMNYVIALEGIFPSRN
ncbi:phage tail protein [Pseudoflavitalea sp. X16]|uniref:phage tail protein n=1 Tax=Paraflavitalea devenefica TaxID=2716334 RepID=UPI001420F63E|nr:tail fiber protein [Paraflavitalea devenefica]NII28216.1 phage tail protein [Paraflavitalea devenefica]